MSSKLIRFRVNLEKKREKEFLQVEINIIDINKRHRCTIFVIKLSVIGHNDRVNVMKNRRIDPSPIGDVENANK